jgi:hypothetical protein
VTGTASRSVLAYIQRHALRSGFSYKTRKPTSVPAKPPTAWKPNALNTVRPRMPLEMLSEIITWAVG